MAAEQTTEITAHFQIRVVALLCSIVFFSVLNGTMFNVVVPDISRDFGLTASVPNMKVIGQTVLKISTTKN